MIVTFLIPSHLREYAGEHRRVEIPFSGGSVGEALAGLWTIYPGLRDRVLTERGAVRQYVNIFVDENNVRDIGGLAAPVRDGCEIMIVPSVAGG